MRALAIVHQPDAGPGVFTEALRERGVELDRWMRAEAESPPRELGCYDAVLAFGGAMHVDEEERHPWLREEKALLARLLDAEVPLLGVCLGGQLVAEAAGAEPHRALEPEIGWYRVELEPEAADDPLLAPLSPGFEAFQWHSYHFPLPPGATPLARSRGCLQACRIGERAWAVQFHAEVSAADADAWITDYQADEDAVRMGIDPDAFREKTRAAIGRWNELGRGIAGRFAEVAANRR